MSTTMIMGLVGDAPPQLFIPSFTDAILGWIMAAVVLLGPLALVLGSWQRRHGRWWYMFSQWNTLAFWLLLGGSAAGAIGMFGLIGLIPAWQNVWNAWFLAINRTNPTMGNDVLGWLQGSQQQFAFVLQVTASIIFLLGAAAIAIGQSRMARKMPFYQRAGSDDWLVSPAEVPSSSSTSRNPTHPIMN
jgi:hypothetical protein